MVGVAEYRDWFDSDGRLVKEAQMRQCVFEGEGEIRVDPDCCICISGFHTEGEGALGFPPPPPPPPFQNDFFFDTH